MEGLRLDWGIDDKRIRASKLKALGAQWEGEIRFQQVGQGHGKGMGNQA